MNPSWIGTSSTDGVLERGLACVTAAGSVAVGDALETRLEFAPEVVFVTGGVLERGFAFSTGVGSVIGATSSLVAVIGAASSLVAAAKSLSSEVRRSTHQRKTSD